MPIYFQKTTVIFDHFRQVDTDLLRSDKEWTHREAPTALACFGFCCLIVVENVQQHAREQKNEAARASLNTRKPVRGWPRKDRKPEVAFGDAVIRLLGQHVRELLLLRVTSHGQHTFDLLERDYSEHANEMLG